MNELQLKPIDVKWSYVDDQPQKTEEIEKPEKTIEVDFRSISYIAAYIKNQYSINRISIDMHTKKMTFAQSIRTINRTEVEKIRLSVPKKWFGKCLFCGGKIVRHHRKWTHLKTNLQSLGKENNIDENKHYETHIYCLKKFVKNYNKNSIWFEVIYSLIFLIIIIILLSL